VSRKKENVADSAAICLSHTEQLKATGVHL